MAGLGVENFSSPPLSDTNKKFERRSFVVLLRRTAEADGGDSSELLVDVENVFLAKAGESSRAPGALVTRRRKDPVIHFNNPELILG